MSQAVNHDKTRLQELVEIMADPKTTRDEFAQALEEWRGLNSMLKESP